MTRQAPLCVSAPCAFPLSSSLSWREPESHPCGVRCVPVPSNFDETRPRMMRFDSGGGNYHPIVELRDIVECSQIEIAIEFCERRNNPYYKLSWSMSDRHTVEDTAKVLSNIKSKYLRRQVQMGSTESKKERQSANRDGAPLTENEETRDGFDDSASPSAENDSNETNNGAVVTQSREKTTPPVESNSEQAVKRKLYASTKEQDEDAEDEEDEKDEKDDLDCSTTSGVSQHEEYTEREMADIQAQANYSGLTTVAFPPTADNVHHWGYSGPVPLSVACLLLKTTKKGALFNPDIHARHSTPSHKDMDTAFRAFAEDTDGRMPHVSASFVLFTYKENAPYKMAKVSTKQACDLYEIFAKDKDDLEETVRWSEEQAAGIVISALINFRDMGFDEKVNRLRKWYGDNGETFAEHDARDSHDWYVEQLEKISPIRITPIEGRQMVSFAAYALSHNPIYLPAEKDIGTKELRRKVESFFVNCGDLSVGSVVQMISLPTQDRYADDEFVSMNEYGGLMELSFALQDRLTNARPLSVADKLIHFSRIVYFRKLVRPQDADAVWFPWQKDNCNSYVGDLRDEIYNRMFPASMHSKKPKVKLQWRSVKTALKSSCIYVMKHYLLSLKSAKERQDIVEEYVPSQIGENLKTQLEKCTKEWTTLNVPVAIKAQLITELVCHCCTICAYYAMMFAFATAGAVDEDKGLVDQFLRLWNDQLTLTSHLGGCNNNPGLQQMLHTAAFLAFRFYVPLQPLMDTMLKVEDAKRLEIEAISTGSHKTKDPRFRYANRDQWRQLLKESMSIYHLTKYYASWNTNGTPSVRGLDMCEYNKNTSVGGLYPFGKGGSVMSVADVILNLSDNLADGTVKHKTDAVANFNKEQARAEYRDVTSLSALTPTFYEGGEDTEIEEIDEEEIDEEFDLFHLLARPCNAIFNIDMADYATYLTRASSESDGRGSGSDGEPQPDKPTENNKDEKKTKPTRPPSKRNRTVPPQEPEVDAPAKKKRRKTGRGSKKAKDSVVKTVVLYKENTVFVDGIVEKVAVMKESNLQQVAPLIVEAFANPSKQGILKKLKALLEAETKQTSCGGRDNSDEDSEDEEEKESEDEEETGHDAGHHADDVDEDNPTDTELSTEEGQSERDGKSTTEGGAESPVATKGQTTKKRPSIDDDNDIEEQDQFRAPKKRKGKESDKKTDKRATSKMLTKSDEVASNGSKGKESDKKTDKRATSKKLTKADKVASNGSKGKESDKKTDRHPKGKKLTKATKKLTKADKLASNGSKGKKSTKAADKTASRKKMQGTSVSKVNTANDTDTKAVVDVDPAILESVAIADKNESDDSKNEDVTVDVKSQEGRDQEAEDPPKIESGLRVDENESEDSRNKAEDQEAEDSQNLESVPLVDEDEKAQDNSASDVMNKEIDTLNVPAGDIRDSNGELVECNL